MNITTFLLTFKSVLALAVVGKPRNTELVTPKSDVVSVNLPWKRLSNGLELLFGKSHQDFVRAKRLCKAQNAIIPYEGMVDSIRPCLQNRDNYFWLQTCSNEHDITVFNVSYTRNVSEEEYHNYVCVITTAIKTDLTIQVKDQSNTTYSNNGTKNIFQAWTGQTLNLFCQSALKNMLPRLRVKNGTNDLASKDSSIMTWTPENCQDDISVTCESRHCSEDVHSAVQTEVSIKVQCPLEIVSFTSNTRYDTKGTHIYTIGADVTFTCVTKGSSDVTIGKTQGMKMRETVVSRNHTYSITGFSCNDTGTYYCITKQGDTQVNRSINIGVDGSCPPRLCPEETSGKERSDIRPADQQVTVCVMAFPVLSDIVSFNGQNVVCDGGISTSPWQCSTKKSQHFMTYKFTFMIQNVSLLVEKKITVGLKTSEGGVLNLTYSLNADGEILLITPPPVSPSLTTTVTTTVAPLNDTPEAASHSLGVIIGIVSIVIVLLIIMLGVLYWKMKGECGKYGSYTCDSPPSLMPNHNGHSNGGSKNAEEVELYSTVTVDNSPNPIQARGDSQESTESRYMPWSAVERESNVNLNQNLTETKCSSTEERYANLRTLKNMPGPSGLTVSQPANNGALKAHRQNGYHPMKPVSSNPTASSYTSPEGLHYVTVAHSTPSNGRKQSSSKREGDSRERDSVQYASLDLEKTGKYNTERDKRKLKMLKHKTHS